MTRRPSRAGLYRMASALALTAALASTAACGTTAQVGGAAGVVSDMPPLPASATAPVVYPHDVHSYAAPQTARVKHVDLNLDADFAARTLSGVATLDVTGEAGATTLILDVRDMDIRGVRNASGPLTFVLGAADPILGQALTITVPAFAAAQTQKIMVDYATRPEAAALQWLNPAQTSGRVA